jgi:serine O-acetyltransferase
MTELIKRIGDAFQRHGGSLRSLSFYPVLAYEYGRWVARQPSGPARWLGGKVYGLLLTTIELGTGCTINCEARIGEGLLLPHAHNVRIDPAAVLGRRCCVFQDVVIGTNMDRPGAPTLGDDVHVGAGAKILGPVRIGDRANIAANSLVIADVPAGATAVGVPARVLRYTGRDRDGSPRDAAAPPPASDAQVA